MRARKPTSTSAPCCIPARHDRLSESSEPADANASVLDPHHTQTTYQCSIPPATAGYLWRAIKQETAPREAFSSRLCMTFSPPAVCPRLEGRLVWAFAWRSKGPSRLNSLAPYWERIGNPFGQAYFKLDLFFMKTHHACFRRA